MQIQKVNSRQNNTNFKGGLVRVSPESYLDIDAIKFFRSKIDATGGNICIAVKHHDEVNGSFFSSNPKKAIDLLHANFMRAKALLSGQSHKVIEGGSSGTPLRTIGNADSIIGITLDEKTHDICVALSDGTWTNAEIRSLTKENAITRLEEFASYVHKLKSPYPDRDIVDLFVE